MRAVDVVSRGVMALIAVTGFDGPGDQVGIAKRISVLAARAVAVLALNVGEVSKRRIRRLHVRPVGRCQHFGESPPKLGGDIVKPAIDCIGIGVVANGMALQAGRAGGTRPAVDAVGEDLRVESVLPRCDFVFRNLAATVTQGAGVEAHVGASRDGLGHIGGTAAGSDDGGDDGVLSHHVRAKEGASGYLIDQAICWIIDGHIHSQRAGGERRLGRYRRIGESPGDADYVGGGNGDVHLRLQIGRRPNTDGVDPGRILNGGGEFIIGDVPGSQRAQDELSRKGRSGARRDSSEHGYQPNPYQAGYGFLGFILSTCFLLLWFY